ncbi:retrovirus-related Pol polyprotein from type-1 retrotransposable element R2 [Trichonephila clavipes]|nr:retrovirus-related Pol polyprotein from type-1 retrotransposable element R2 [Trichonephila clavipes]
MLGQTLRLTFPVREKLQCPFVNCTHAFSSKSWYSSKANLKRHLRWFHRVMSFTTEYWCGVCQARIHSKPAMHTCLNGELVAPSSPSPGSDWACPDCDFVATSRLGLQNHSATHKRESLQDKSVPLRILPGPSQRKRERQRKLAPLTTGAPGDLPLAPILQDPALQPQGSSSGNVQGGPEARKIDTKRPKVLDSFRDPLDMLLSTDELPEKRQLFCTLVEDITEAVRTHFNLAQPPNESQPSTRPKGLDTSNPQRVQSVYRWNRRKCVRAIANPDSTRCGIPKERIQAFFQEIWEVPRDLAIEPPEAPPSASSPSPSQRPLFWN